MTSPKLLKKTNIEIKRLNIEKSAYVALELQENSFFIAIKIENIIKTKKIKITDTLEENIFNWLELYAIKKNIKIIAITLISKNLLEILASRLWLESDIIPYFLEPKQDNPENNTVIAVQELASKFDENDLVKVQKNKEGEVEVSWLIMLKNYKDIISEKSYNLLLSEANKFKGKKMVFLNSTTQGGGVALMRHALIRLYRLLGVDVKWYVVDSNLDIFGITKNKFHNILQGVAPQGVFLNKEDKKKFNKWSKKNALRFKQLFKKTDVVIIDDPQPSGLVKYLKEFNPKIKIIYRSHIQLVTDLMATPETPQNITWSFIRENIEKVDIFVAHPINKFIPKDISVEKTVLMPATSDQLDGLNKELNERQIIYYIKIFNKFLIENGQSKLDLERDYICQIARFDPSKGIPDVLESYRLLREKLKKEKRKIPQLVIVGHDAVDDPQGMSLYIQTLETLKSDTYKDFSDDIKVAKLPHGDQILNAILRKSKVVLQLSHKEGFEIKVTEALSKGKPVVTYRTGGIKLQVVYEKDTVLLKVGNVERVADYLFKLFSDNEYYKKMSQKAIDTTNQEFFTPPNATSWLFLANKLIEDKNFKGNGKYIHSLIRKEYSKKKLLK